MTKIYKSILFFLCFCAFYSPVQSQKRRVGYLQSWKAQITPDQASKLTHVVYSFVTIHPDLDGKLNSIDENYLSNMVSIAQSNGAKAILAVGGWFPCSYANQSGPCAADANPEAFDTVSQGNTLTNFVNNLYNMVVKHNMDGIDVDWEYPSGSSQNLYVSLLSALRNKMNSHPTKNLELSSAVPASAFRGQHFSYSAFQYLNDVNIMAYDNDPRINHSTYNFAVSGINYWKGRGVSNTKLNLGLPFYGWNSSGSSLAYKDIVNADLSAPNKVYPNGNTCDQSNGYGYNAKRLIRDKVKLAINENIGGVMVWAIDQDHPNPSNSLLNVIDATLNSGGGGSGGGGNGGGSCSAWSAGTNYYVGDIVTYNGQNYICEHNNPGYDPTISTWFWDPTSQSCGGNSGGSSCVSWVAGTNYYVGDIVTYNGQNYICEHNNPGYDPVISHWFWEPTSASCKTANFGSTKNFKRSKILLTPNPFTNGSLNIQMISVDVSLTKVNIIDMKGRIVQSFRPKGSKKGDDSVQVNDLYLDKGTYIISIFTTKGVTEETLVVH
ncbi:glycosyl hydrolase family 18 protein [Aquimarina sp. M1]